MSFCEHCQGQRFDRARVLRTLRQMRRELGGRAGSKADAAFAKALNSVRALEIPHLDYDDQPEDHVVH